jgi:hypothetical protein
MIKSINLSFKFYAGIIIFLAFISSTLAQKVDNSKTKNQTAFSTSLYSGKIQHIKKLVTLSGNCYAYAPDDWIILGSRAEGDAVDIASMDRNLYAGYMIVAVSGNMARDWYGQIRITPQTFLNNIISTNGKFFVSYGIPFQDSFSYTVLPFEVNETELIKGVVYYQVWPIPGDPYGFVIAIRTARTVKRLWETMGAQAISVALSIRSVVQFQSKSNANYSDNSNDKKIESGYNMQLGMEYAHDPDTGENYWVSPSKDYNQNGPEGPGYYIRVGNDTKKLVSGRSDN